MSKIVFSEYNNIKNNNINTIQVENKIIYDTYLEFKRLLKDNSFLINNGLDKNNLEFLKVSDNNFLTKYENKEIKLEPYDLIKVKILITQSYLKGDAKLKSKKEILEVSKIVKTSKLFKNIINARKRPAYTNS